MKSWRPPTQEIQRLANEHIAHGALTNSKRPECLVQGVYPTHLEKGQGCHVWDIEGNKYVDFICGLGSNILGYGHPEWAQAITDRAHLGASLSLSTPLEIKCAEKIKEVMPFIEKVRFLKTGSDACSAAIRIARAKTQRHLVITEGYHGWHDEFVSITPPALGVPPQRHIKKFLDEHDVRDVAAIIIEPIMTDMSEKRIEWLKAIRQQCDEHGIVLIFDEVITGFRFPKFSVSNYLSIQPDLICLGKAMGNGMPISVVGGKTEIMNCGEYFISSTFAGETLSLAAAIKTISLLQTKYSLDDLWSTGRRFQEKFNEMWPEGVRIEGYPTRGAFAGDPLNKALFWQEACMSGLIFGPSWFFNFSHISVTDQVLKTCEDILFRVKTGQVKLLGQMPKSPFAQKQREQK